MVIPAGALRGSRNTRIKLFAEKSPTHDEERMLLFKI